MSIAVWRAAPTVPEIKRIDEHLGELSLKFPNFASVVVIDSSTFRPPANDARQEHASLTLKYEASALGAAMVLDGQSIKQQVFRFVLTTIQLMSSPKVPQNIFGSVTDAARWISEINPGLIASELEFAIRDARKLAPYPGSATA